MNDFYSKITDPSLNGAIFIVVCREGREREGKIGQSFSGPRISGYMNITIHHCDLKQPKFGLRKLG
ncbi:hypothetical protein DPMN_091297 [Dreissena polymorpha]|uniref:Uncharacterized protein n=1 Tax=Dreissena polymorpha TaxID=45954 RepID=A0A9D4L052_DREPO|nr:hypothetical protein DPMN_091297 [Dreissena polymorpha]